MAIPSSAKHHEVHVTFGDQHADIDKAIAPLVKEMWRAGIVTSQSCQDSPSGWIWLEFVSSFALEKFLNIVGDYDSAVGSLHDRMLHGYDRLGGPRVGQWRFEAIVHDLGVNIVEDGAEEREEYRAPRTSPCSFPCTSPGRPSASACAGSSDATAKGHAWLKPPTSSDRTRANRLPGWYDCHTWYAAAWSHEIP